MDNIIYQGSTPMQEITLPIPTDLIKEAIVTYLQNDEIVFERKSPDGISFNGYDLVFQLTQEETFSLEANKIVSIQLVIKLQDDDVVPSDPIYAYVGERYNKEVL